MRPRFQISTYISNHQFQFRILRDPTRVGSTTGLIITDGCGNIACITLTLEQTFGTAMTVLGPTGKGRGFFLNNELTDFNYTAQNAILTANSPEPCKRPRSAMAPTLVFKNGLPLIAFSSSGGVRIPGAIFQAIINKVDYNYSIENILLEGRYSQTNSATTAYDWEAADQSGNLNSAMKLLTTYKKVPQSHFAAFIERIQSTLACITFDGITTKAGFNLPSRVVPASNITNSTPPYNYPGSVKTINTTYSTTGSTAVWNPLVNV